MSRPRVAVTSILPGRAMSWLEAECDVRVAAGDGPTDAGRLIELIGDRDGVVTLLANPVDASVLAACPRLKVVANCAVGYDNVDLEAARSRGVWVTNTPDVLTEATADLTFALILAVTRRVVEADRFLRAGRWTGWRLDLLLGSGLQGARLGIIGFGRIGRAVAHRAPAFGMQVVVADPTWQPEAGLDVEATDLDSLLATCDIVTLHCPLTPATHHLLDETRLRTMIPGAVLINTARGPLVDESALARVLEEGRLAGAGLDVFENEPDVHSSLIGREDVVLLPHIGSATRETRAAMAELAAQNLLAVLAGRTPPTAVVHGTFGG